MRLISLIKVKIFYILIFVGIQQFNHNILDGDDAEDKINEDDNDTNKGLCIVYQSCITVHLGKICDG